MRHVDGREFTASVINAKPPLVVVNGAFARQIFGTDDPIGKFVGSSFREPAKAEYEIIGVVRDAKYRSLREPMIPTVFHLWI